MDDFLKFSGKKFKQSRFARIYPNGEDLLYHTFFMKLLKLDKESLSVYNSFKNGESLERIVQENPSSVEFIKKLIKEKMLVNASLDEGKKIKDFFERNLDQKGLTIMYLLTTDECNLNCKYCFIEGTMPSDHEFKKMSEETAKKAVDFFRGNTANRGTPMVIFYGGEPMLNEPVVKYVINKVRAETLFDISMVTNGTRINQENAKFLAQNRISIGVSIDGRQNIHNQARQFRDGKGTYQEAVRAFNLLKDAGAENVGISLTIGSHNVQTLPEEVEYLYETLKPKGISFNFLVDSPCQKNLLATPIEYATTQAIEGFKILREKGVYEDRMMRKIRPFIKGVLHLKDCGALGNQIVVGPDGKIGPCQAFITSGKYFDQSINENPTLNHPSFKEWGRRYPLQMEECIDCDAVGICGGGCAYQAFVDNGTIHSLDKRMCTHNKQFLEWLIQDVSRGQK